jgi:NADH-quinone oxidoreductase subunit J
LNKVDWVFYIASSIALVASLLVVTARNAVHAALHLVVSLLAVALIFFSLGAAFAAALEIIVYAGAILVMVLFVIMLLNLGQVAEDQERRWLRPKVWIVPGLLSLSLLALLIWSLVAVGTMPGGAPEIPVKRVAMGLFGPYVLGVELASMLLLSGLVGAFHLSRRERSDDAGRRVI